MRACIRRMGNKKPEYGGSLPDFQSNRELRGIYDENSESFQLELIMAARIHQKGAMPYENLDPDQMRQLQMLLGPGYGAPTTTLDYDKVADRNITAATWVMIVFWGFVVTLLLLLGIVGVRTYCRVWAKPRRLNADMDDVVVLTKPR